MSVQRKTSSRSSGPPPAAESAKDLLARIGHYLAADLRKVDRLISEALSSQIDLTNQVSHYLSATSGKRLRPVLTLLAAGAAGERNEASVHAAAMVELVHLASLLHDDVIDHAPLRRGKATVNAQWGNEVAILMADFLFSRAFAIAFEWLPNELLAHLVRTTTAMCDGELFQIGKSGQRLVEEDYYYVIRCKTAGLFSACMRFGSQLAGADPSAISALERYGLEFGLAFQITDDVLDLTAEANQLGKEIGTDIACGKQTLPLIRAIEKANAPDRAFLLDALNNSQMRARVRQCVAKYEGIEYALEVARQHARQARQCLADLPRGAARDFLLDLTEMVTNRTY